MEKVGGVKVLNKEKISESQLATMFVIVSLKK
jgi:hypothetical protein